MDEKVCEALWALINGAKSWKDITPGAIRGAIERGGGAVGPNEPTAYHVGTLLLEALRIADSPYRPEENAETVIARAKSYYEFLRGGAA